MLGAMIDGLLAAAADNGGGSSDPASWQDFLAPGIAGLSLVVAVVFGISNRRTAQRALEISQRQESRRESRLDLHLNQAAAWRETGSADRTLGVHVLATNPTDRASALVRAELHITYDADGVLATVKVPHADGRQAPSKPSEVALIALPAPLDANSAISGWFVFRVAAGLTLGYPIDRYDFVVRDVHGIEERLQVSLFHEAERDQAI